MAERRPNAVSDAEVPERTAGGRVSRPAVSDAEVPERTAGGRVSRPAVSDADMEEQVRILRTGAVDLITEADFRRKLASGRSLRIKLGIDPTASDIHLGFAVVLRKLRQFQELGHTAVLIIGDFTAQVGDPSGRSATRPRLSKEEVEAYATTYVEQASRILLDDPLEIRRNSEWLGTMGIEDVLRLAARTTVARMLERDDFSRRYRDGVAISVMEFLYPLLQGWDSVMVEADVELGGTDQLFNNLMGRTLQEQEGQEGQCVLTTPVLEGLDGVNKMSKSLDNFVGIAEAPAEQFGKLLSLPDELMPRYFTLTTGWYPDRIAEVTDALADGSLKPVDAKRLLARTVVDLYHGDGAGEAAQARVRPRLPGPRGAGAPRRAGDPGRPRRAPRRPHPPVAAGGPGLPEGGAVEQGGAAQDRAGRRPSRRRGGHRSRARGHAGRGRREDAPDGQAELGPVAGLIIARGERQSRASVTTPPMAMTAITTTATQKIQPLEWTPKLPTTSRSPACRVWEFSVGVPTLARCWGRFPLRLFLAPLDPMGGETSAGAQKFAVTSCRSPRQPVVSPIRPENRFRWIDTDAPADPAPRGSGGGRGECRLGARGTVARPQGRPAFRCRVVAP